MSMIIRCIMIHWQILYEKYFIMCQSQRFNEHQFHEFLSETGAVHTLIRPVA